MQTPCGAAEIVRYVPEADISLMRIAVVRLVTFWGRSAGIVAFLGLTITVVALVVVVAFRRWSVDVIVSRRRSIAGRRGIGVRGGRHIIAICGRVVRIGHWIPVSPVVAPPVANVLNRAYLNVCSVYS